MSGFASGLYWAEREDLLYYRYVDYIARTVGRDASSLLDVGSGNCPYIEWFFWINKKYSVDLQSPYSSENVIGIEGNIHTLSFAEKFDLVTCLQVLEHVPDAKAFAQRLLELGKTLIVSVPFKWPEGKAPGHIHDPVDAAKMRAWFQREPNYSIVVREPFLWVNHERLICVYDQDPLKKYGMDSRRDRILRGGSP